MSRRIVKEATVNVSPDVVWRALTDAKELEQWFPIEARVEPGLGGTIFLSWGQGAEGTAPITGWDRPRHFQWTESRGPVKLFIDFFVEAAAGGTARVRLVQSGFGDGAEWDDEFHMLEGGWAWFMTHLEWYLNRHLGGLRQLVSAREAVDLSRPEAFERLRAALEALKPITLVDSPKTQQWGARVPDLNDALLFLEVEPHQRGSRPGLWVSTFGLTPERLAGARDRVQAIYRSALT
jgi:uncharacterized protein YndB with AHSA1/START domain